MKKLLFAFALIFFAGFSANTVFAATLKGTITDPIKNIDISNQAVKVTLGTGDSAKTATSKKSGFKFTDFTPDADGWVELKLEKDKYTTIEGDILCEVNSQVCSVDGDCDLCSKYELYEKNTRNKIADITQEINVEEKEVEVIGITDPETGEAIYQTQLVEVPGDFILNIEMVPVKEEIISGVVTDANGEPLENVTVSAIVVDNEGADFEIASNTTKSDGKYSLKGYLNKSYSLTFTHKIYYEKKTDSNKPIAVKDEAKEFNFELTEKTRQQIEEEDMHSMTGFGCSDLMPRYLVGANCQESRELDGDATDIAHWIQKFGGMITSVISFIAVLLIIWNAFNLVTAAGDTEKISAAKKGLIWTIVGLALTMFAYIIVKTVIMLAYTQ